MVCTQPRRLAALDVGIISPAASGAGANCVETMRARKVARLEPFSAELDAQDIHYRPVTFSCFGRPHPDAHKAIVNLARRSARRRGREPHLEERRMMSRVTSEIWKRAARMLCKCWPEVVSDPHFIEEDEPDAECQKRAGPPATVELETL